MDGNFCLLAKFNSQEFLANAIGRNVGEQSQCVLTTLGIYLQRNLPANIVDLIVEHFIHN